MKLNEDNLSFSTISMSGSNFARDFMYRQSEHKYRLINKKT